MVHVNPLLSKFAVADDLFALLSWTQLLGFPPFLYFSADLCPAVLHQHPYCETWTSEYKHRWQSSQVKSCLRGHSGSPCSSCWCSCCEDRIGTCAAAHPTGVCVCVWSLVFSSSQSLQEWGLFYTLQYQNLVSVHFWAKISCFHLLRASCTGHWAMYSTQCLLLHGYAYLLCCLPLDPCIPTPLLFPERLWLVAS